MLSWKPFIPLAGLNFNAYMVNTILPVADTASRRSPHHFDIRNFVSIPTIIVFKREVKQQKKLLNFRRI